MSKSTVHLAIVAIVFAPLAIKAQDFDPEAISQVSKAIAEHKLMSDSEAEERQVYVSSSLSPKVEKGTGQGISTVIGLSAFGEDYAFFGLELQRRLMRSYDFKINLSSTQLSELNRALKAEPRRGRSPSWEGRDPLLWMNSEMDLTSIPIYRTRLPSPVAGQYRLDGNNRMILIDPERMGPRYRRETPGTVDPDSQIAHELGHHIISVRNPGASRKEHEDFANYFMREFDRERELRYRVENRIAQDFRKKGYNVTVYGSYRDYCLDRARWNLEKIPDLRMSITPPTPIFPSEYWQAPSTRISLPKISISKPPSIPSIRQRR